MKLLNIKIKGFMKYKEEFEVKFDNETYIIGGNAKGKTTIAYAVAWAFLGTNLRGNDKVSLINRESEDCIVELNFIDNDNIKHNLIRYKHNKYSAKNSLLLDGKPVKQEYIEKFYIEKQLFLSIYNPDYFKDATPAKQKELIDKYLPNIPILEIYNKLAEDEKSKIDITQNTDITKLIKDNCERIKDIDKKILNKKGNLEYAKKITEEKLEDKKKFDKQEEQDLLEQEKDYLELESKQKQKEKLQNEIGEKEAKQLNIQIQLDKINEKGKQARIEYNKILSDPLATCPCCNQPFNNNSKSIALETKRKEMFKLDDDKKELEKQLSNEKVDVMQLKMELYSFGKIDNSKRISEIDIRLKELKAEKEKIENFNKEIDIKNNNIEKTRKDIINIVAELEKLDEEKEKYNLQNIIVKKMYCMLIQEKMKFAEKYMNNTKIQFYELVKSTGEIKDCFKITRNGEEFSYLSKAQKFITILEICNMLNKISGLNIPILIDDSESYPDFKFKYEDFKTQLIIIKAKRNRLLKISNNDETITNVKTLKSYTKLKEYKKVA